MTDRPSLVQRSHTAGVGLTAVEVEEEMLRIMALMEDATHDMAKLACEAAEAEVGHKGLYATAFVQSPETSDVRRGQDATLRTTHALRSRKMGEAVYEAQKQLLLTLRAELDALRSISANIRSQT